MFVLEKMQNNNVKYAIDFPKQLQLEGILFIQGWVAVSGGATAYLRCNRKGAESETYVLNKNRGDVVKYLSSKGDQITEPCGFAYTLEDFDIVELVYKAVDLGETVLAKIHKASTKFNRLDRVYDKKSYPFLSIEGVEFDSPIKNLSKLLLNHNYKKSLEKIISMVESGDILSLWHPVFPEVNTYAVFSKRYSGCNFILYKSVCEKYEWVMVQVENFIDAILLPDFAYYTFSEAVADQVLSSFNKIFAEGFTLQSVAHSDTESLFFLGHPRPFHYIYDQYVNFLKSSELRAKQCVFYSDSYFLPSDYNSLVVEKNRSQIYYALNNVGLNFKIKFHGLMPDLYHQDFEKKLYKSTSDGYASENLGVSKLKIWIGITGQKRAWKEQVIGYANILNNLSVFFDKVEVLIDGWTAVNKAIANDIDDLIVVHDICSRLSKDISVINMVGFDYEEKIIHAHGCDCFISNAGSGAIVPLRIARLSGALHSNPAIITFPFDANDLAFSQVKVFLNNGECGLGMSADYSLGWREIYNHIISVLNVNRKLEIPALDFEARDAFEIELKCDRHEGDFPAVTLDQIKKLYGEKHYLECYQSCLWFLKICGENKEVRRYLFNSRLNVEPHYSQYVGKCLQVGFFSISIRGLLFHELPSH